MAADLEVLKKILPRFGKESALRKATGWIAEKLARIKTKSAGEKTGQLGLVQALEALVLGYGEAASLARAQRIIRHVALAQGSGPGEAGGASDRTVGAGGSTAIGSGPPEFSESVSKPKKRGPRTLRSWRVALSRSRRQSAVATERKRISHNGRLGRAANSQAEASPRAVRWGPVNQRLRRPKE